MSGDVTSAFDRIIAAGHFSKEQVRAAEFQLAVCEGSDGLATIIQGRPSVTLKNNSGLNFANLYRLQGEEPPAYLALSFTQGMGAPAMGGAMRPGVEHV